jgi:Sulfotransferase family
MRPIFIGGCERSGTTLLASLLAQDEHVVMPPEAQFFLEALAATRDVDPGERTAACAAFISGHWRYQLWELPRALLGEMASASSTPSALMAGLASAYAEQVGEMSADAWVDHTPVNIGYASTLFEQFDAAPLVHIIRDPRAVIASLLPLDWGPSSARSGARWWLSRIAMGLAAEAAFPERVFRLRYEDLVREPAASLKPLCSSLGVAYTPAMARGGGARLPAYTQQQHALVGKAPDSKRIDAWRSKLSDGQIAIIEGELGDVPSLLGYDAVLSGPSVAHGSSAYEFVASSLRTAGQRLRYRSRVRGAIKQTESR